MSSFGEVARKRLEEDETWRVAFGLNRAALPASFPRGEAAWNPEGTKTGTCRWTFSNLMRQGDVVLSGDLESESTITVDAENGELVCR